MTSEIRCLWASSSAGKTWHRNNIRRSEDESHYHQNPPMETILSHFQPSPTLKTHIPNNRSPFSYSQWPFSKKWKRQNSVCISYLSHSR
jgi:hypothetical protein